MAGKSHLERLLEANRKGKKTHRGKAVRQYLPPEMQQAQAVSATSIPSPPPPPPRSVPQEDTDDPQDRYEDEYSGSDFHAPDDTPDDIPDDIPIDETDPPEDSQPDVLSQYPDSPDHSQSESHPAIPAEAQVGDKPSSAHPVSRPVSRLPSTRPVRSGSGNYSNRPILAPVPAPVRPYRAANDTTAPGQIVIDLPAPTLAAYSSQCPPTTPLRQYLSTRLTNCQSHSGTKPIHLSDNHRRKIEQFAHRDFSSPEELVGWLLSSTDVFVGSQSIDIEPYLMQRVVDRLPSDRTLAQYLTELLEYGIMTKTGML